jgi:CheY-like chemotaxis protein
MSAKRALVVDDSKSARVILARMLEKYSIDVDSAESAEQAIEYLTRHRPPDVIFMDHLMPGMDGFQALTAIKNNPRTATVPVLMYTSQEGELYVGQARALGAVGVLPKQIQPADVSKVLHQLHLLPERRSTDPSTLRPAGVAQEDLGESAAGRPLTDAALREHLIELRRALVAALDSHASRMESDLRATLEQALSRRSVFDGTAVRPARWGWIVAVIAGIIASESLYIAHRDAERRTALASEVAQLDSALAAATGAGGPQASAAPAASSAPQSAPARTEAASLSQPAQTSPIVEVVPYGEPPLGGSRLDALRELFDRLTAQGYHGTVDIRIFPGRFCLTGDAATGYSLAPDATAYSQCALVEPDPIAAAPSPQHFPVGFADLVSSFHAASHGGVEVRVAEGDASSTIVAYPPVTDSLTAGEWNRAASANNRIEINVR